MKISISKTESTLILKITGIWTLLNIVLNIFGLLITKLVSHAPAIFPESLLSELVLPLSIQSVLFAFFTFAIYLFLKEKKVAFYGFVMVQAVIFHFILLTHLKFHGLPFFVSSFADPGMKYLSYGGQYLVDVLYQFIPLKGNYENNMFMPLNTGKFYFHWIFMVLAYDFGLTWASLRILKYYSGKNMQKQGEGK